MEFKKLYEDSLKEKDKELKETKEKLKQSESDLVHLEFKFKNLNRYNDRRVRERYTIYNY